MFSVCLLFVWFIRCASMPGRHRFVSLWFDFTVVHKQHRVARGGETIAPPRNLPLGLIPMVFYVQALAPQGKIVDISRQCRSHIHGFRRLLRNDFLFAAI
jgi:hypothetical protein